MVLSDPLDPSPFSFRIQRCLLTAVQTGLLNNKKISKSQKHGTFLYNFYKFSTSVDVATAIQVLIVIIRVTCCSR
jgi:hypothetical protein